jgi:type I restriction enzyme S subunit
MMLPTGWREAALAEVATLSSGGTPKAKNPAYYDGDIPWAIIGDLNDGVVRSTAQSITQRGLDNSSAKVVPVNTILLGMYGSIGKLGLAGIRLATNQAIATIRAGDQVDYRYLFYYLLAQRRDLDHQGKGAAQRNISQTVLKPWPIRFPSDLDEQRRIVALLDDHLSRLDASDAYVRAGLAHAQVWYAKVIDQLVWSPGNPHREVRSLLREPMRNGRSDRAVQDSEGGTRTLTLTAVTRNSFINEHTKLTTTTRDRAVGLWLEPGDILVQRSNTLELVGTSARFDGPRDWAIFPDLLIRLRADDSVVDSRFLSAALRSKRGHVQLRRRAKGAAGSMPKIDQEAVGSVLIPLPSGKDQRRIVAQVAAADTGLRQLRAELEAVQLRSAALRRSLLAAAFSDRLSEASVQTATA